MINHMCLGRPQSDMSDLAPRVSSQLVRTRYHTNASGVSSVAMVIIVLNILSRQSCIRPVFVHAGYVCCFQRNVNAPSQCD